MKRLAYILYRIAMDIISLLSRALNAFVFGGSTAQTLSARAHIEDGWATHRRVINAIFFWQSDHCKSAWEEEVERAKYVLEVLHGANRNKQGEIGNMTIYVENLLTATAASVTGEPAPTRTWQWLRNSTVIPGATNNTYTVTEDDLGSTLSVRQIETNIAGTASATSEETVTVTYAAPTASAALADQTFDENTGVQTFDPTGDFTVTGDADLSSVTWSLPTTVSGVTINSVTGIISIDTDTTAVQAASPIVVRATNSGGIANSGFNLTIQAVSTVVLSTLTLTSPQQTDGDIAYTFSMSEAGDHTVRMKLVAGAATGTVWEDFAAVEDLGTVTLNNAASPLPITISTSGLNAQYKVVAEVVGSTGGITVSNAIFMDTAPLVLSASSPADGATSVAVNSPIVLDFDDDVAATGTITLRIVGGAAVETFDLSTGSGSNGGSVALSANATTTDRVTLTLGASMSASTSYAIRTSGLTDTTSQAMVDIVDDTTLNFTTAAAAGAPTDAGRVAWWDASDTGTISDSGGTVTSVANKVGGGNALVPDTTGQQTTGATTRGGNNVIDFTGTSNPLEADITFTGTDFAVWIVLNVGTVNNSNDSMLALKGATNILNLRADNASAFNGYTNCNWGSGGAWTGGPYSGWYIVKQQVDRSGTNTFSTDVNGSNIFSAALTADPETTQRIYVQSNEFQHLPGSVAEIIFTTDITVDYLSYLQSKWGF